jgi:hypothetical protein
VRLIATLQRMVWWARFAGVPTAFRPSQAVALAPTTIDMHCARSAARSVGSADALLAGTIDASRLWVARPSESVAAHSRIVRVDGIRQPSFGDETIAYRTEQRAYMRARSGLVFPRTGLVMPAFGTVLRNDSSGWLAEHRLLPGFVDFIDDQLMARASDLVPARRVRQPVLVLCHAFHRNYAHWLFDCLPWLMPWLDHLRDDHLAVLVPPLLGNWQRRTLELLGVPNSALIEASEGSVLCTDMIVPGMFMRQSAEPPPQAAASVDVKAARRRWPRAKGPAVIETIEALRAAARGARYVERPERIYVSRRGTASFRTMLNEHEVEAALARLGFAIVRPL